jgi:hypothetical protein
MTFEHRCTPIQARKFGADTWFLTYEQRPDGGWEWYLTCYSLAAVEYALGITSAEILPCTCATCEPAGAVAA